MNPPLRRGEQVWLAGLTTGHRMMRRQCTVTTATCAMTIAPATVPRFRAVHEEVDFCRYCCCVARSQQCHLDGMAQQRHCLTTARQGSVLQTSVCNAVGGEAGPRLRRGVCGRPDG